MKKIPLTQGRVALVDDEDFERLNKYKWCTFKTRYGGFVAVRNTPKVNGKRGLIYMHRQIMGAPDGMDVDHRKNNTLDNQKHNLRICTRTQNLRNSLPRKNCSSEFKGVSWHKSTKKWRAYINSGGKQQNLGVFGQEESAARAYDKKAVELFGEFAHLNFPKNGRKNLE